MKAWLSSQVAEGLKGQLPDEVEVDVFDGGEIVPDSVGVAEFYVPAFLAPPPSVGEVMERMPSLRVVQTLTAGVEALRPYVPDGVTLCNARGVHDASTAEWVVGAIVASLHEFPRFAVAQRDARWDYKRTDSLADKTVLIVGYGSIGEALERRLSGFEVEVLRVARSARAGVASVDNLARLLPLADVVVLLVPTTPETKGLVDAAFLKHMRDGALLVNAARGSVVDTGALVSELESGRLRAALDVADPEPPPPDHPLWRAPGLLLTPHVAGSTPASARRSLELVRRQIERCVAGQTLANVISGPY